MVKSRFGYIALSFFTLALLVVMTGPRELSGANETTLLAMPEVGTMHGMRAISRSDDGVYKDMSASGMLVGTGPNETRIVVFKPAFTKPVANYIGWTVTDVAYQIGGTNVTLHSPLRYWSGVTPSKEIYSLPKSDITTQYLIDLFQTQLSAGGNYARTTGVYVTGVEKLQNANPVNIAFAVTVRNPSAFTAEGVSLVDAASNNALFSWRASRRGYAEIYVNNVQVVRDQFTVANRINRNTIYSNWLQTGTNEVYVRVTEPDDINSVAQSPVLTLAR